MASTSMAYPPPPPHAAMASSSSNSNSSRPARASRPSDTFRPRGRLPLDPFAAPAASYAAYWQGSAYASASTSSGSGPPSSPARSHTHPTLNLNPHAQRRDSASSAGSAYEYHDTGAVWRVPRALVYGYDERGQLGQGKKGQVVLVLGDPPASELLPVLASPHLADPATSLVLIATNAPPGYLHLHHQYSAKTHNHDQHGSGFGPGPTIRIMRLAEPLDAHEGGALRLVALFERAARVVDAWRAAMAAYGFVPAPAPAPARGALHKEEKQKGAGKVSMKARMRDAMIGAGERIVQLAEDAQGEFVCVEAYRPGQVPTTPPTPGSASVSAYGSGNGKMGARYSSPPLSSSSDGPRSYEVDQEKERKKRFRFSMGSSTLGGGGGSDSPRPLMESRMASAPFPQPTPSSPSSTLSKAGSVATASPHSAPVSPYASRRLSQSSFSLLSSSSSRADAGPRLPADGRTFDAIVNFLPAQAPDKALLKHAILVSTLGAQYLGVFADQAAAGVPSAYAGVASMVAATSAGGAAAVPATDERSPSEGGGKLRKRASRRMSMTQRLSGFFGLGGGSGGDDKVLKELKEMGEREEKEKQKQKQITPLGAVPVLHAHVVHILPPNMGNAQERPSGPKLVQSIEQFLLNFAYPLGSMLGGTGGRNSGAFGYGYAGSNGSLTSLSSLGSAGMQMNHMGTQSALSSTASSRNSSSSSLSALGTVQHASAHANAHAAHAGSSQTLSQSQSAGQAHPRSRSLFSIGPSGRDSDGGAVMQRGSKPTTPPSAYPAPNMQRQRVRSTGGASPHRPSSMYSPGSYGGAHPSANSGNNAGSLAQLAAQMAGRPVPYLVAPGVFGAPISAVGGTRAGTGARRMAYGEAMLLGVLDWDSGVDGGVGAGAGRAYVAWGDVVCDGEVEGDDAEQAGSPLLLGRAVPLKKHSIESTPRPAPTTTQLPTPPDSSAGSAKSSTEGSEVESEAANAAERRRDLDKTPRYSTAPRFTRSPSSSARSSGSSAESGALPSPTTEAAPLTSFFNDPSKLPRVAEPAAGLARPAGTEANGEPLPLASNNSPSSATPSSLLSAHERRKNHRPAPPPPSTPSPLMTSMVENRSNEKQTKTPALPEMVRNDPLRMSVSGVPTVPPALVNAVGGVEMNRSHNQTRSQEGDAPFFSAVSSVPAAEPPMMITLTSATAASVNPSRSPSEATPPPVTTNGSDSGYGSTESAEAHATRLSHKAARPLHVSNTANPDLPEETQKAMRDAVAKLVGETETETAVDGRLSRRRSSKGKMTKRSQSKTRHSVSSKAASPVVSQHPGQQPSADNTKAAGKDASGEVAKNGKLQGAWRKLGSWRRNGSPLPTVDGGPNPSGC